MTKSTYQLHEIAFAYHTPSMQRPVGLPFKFKSYKSVKQSTGLVDFFDNRQCEIDVRTDLCDREYKA